MRACFLGRSVRTGTAEKVRMAPQHLLGLPAPRFVQRQQKPTRKVAQTAAGRTRRALARRHAGLIRRREHAGHIDHLPTSIASAHVQAPAPQARSWLAQSRRAVVTQTDDGREPAPGTSTAC